MIFFYTKHRLPDISGFAKGNPDFYLQCFGIFHFHVQVSKYKISGEAEVIFLGCFKLTPVCACAECPLGYITPEMFKIQHFLQPVNMSGPVHTYPDIFENASFFIRVKKDLRPHEERFRNYPRPHENALTFELQKQINKMPSSDPQRSERML